MQDKFKRRKMHQAGLEASKKKQEEMMAKAVPEAKAAQEAEDAALIDFSGK